MRLTDLYFSEFLYFYRMKNLCTLGAVLFCTIINAQFKISIESPSSFASKDAILYTLNGSKDIISSKETKNGNQWVFNVPNKYLGMMKIYFPDSNASFNLISENRNVNATLETDGNKIKAVVYKDEANKLMEEVQDLQKKNELIFPALVQIKDYYKDNSEFGSALRKEINRLNQKVSIDADKFPFINYYHTNYNKFLVEQSSVPVPGQEEIGNFLYGSNELLETSSLLRPMLVNYLNSGNNAQVEQNIDNLLKRLDVTTPRGQTVLSELIDIFDVYSMTNLKEKYLGEAKSLKCSINERLASTLKANKNVEMGNVFPNYSFTSPTKTAAKNLHSIKSNKKIILFWSSTCSHCEAELPKILEKYSELKKQNIEVIGLSLDSDANSYKKKVAALPWINDSELKGWNSSYAETYNIHATPTYFILDAQNKIIAKPDHVADALQFLGLK